MNFPVLKGASYALVQANDMVLHQGSTQTSERLNAPDSEYLKTLPQSYRSFEAAAAYPPNQVYIGNLPPKALDTLPKPWHGNAPTGDITVLRTGRYGEIMPQEEFLGLMKAVDVFDLVLLEEGFVKGVTEKLQAHPVVGGWKFLEKLGKNPADTAAIQEQVDNHGAEPMYHEGALVGCVKKAHAFDPALTSHVMFENLASKASAAFALGLLLQKTELDPLDIDYIIECSEEACGDMNQRGGGNFAKAIGEVCGLVNATGSDTRGFCAAPVHALVEAAALVQSGVYKNVVVVAGGATAKLGMNAKDHVKKGLPVLEDVLGAFAAAIGENDGVSPIFRTDIVGRHTIGSGASPQAVTQAIVADPLDRAGLKIADIDTFSVEMQNPEVTEPAGAGDVPKANYKMIAALGVMRKEFERTELNNVVERIAMPGFAPTQGHIPSGVPFLGHCRDMMLAGELNRVMIVGKGSLFLGRLTNLFDGVSFVLEANKGLSSQGGAANGGAPDRKKIRVGLTLTQSEHGLIEMIEGAEQVDNPDIEVVLIGSTPEPIEGKYTCVPVDIGVIDENGIKPTDEKKIHDVMDKMLANGELDAAVTMHYNFPIGVSTIGRVNTPAYGRKSFIASTTGTSDTRRDAALLKNAISAIAVAKACGNTAPHVGALNIEGANTLVRNLQALRDNGYKVNVGESTRADGGNVLRGNDLLQGSAPIMVMDSLTGNVVMKMLSSFTTGGGYESVGDGYGPGVGENFGKIVCILSRASGAPVVAGAIQYAAACAKGGLVKKVREEFAAARKAGLDDILAKINASGNATASESGSAPVPQCPPEKIATTEIAGIEILSLDDAVHTLWAANIYASSGMGCTGPIVLVAVEDEAPARAKLTEAGYL
ncbi:MAG: glycine/sarcosine/betaine reductase complex component C subunit beta [Defluviitaleaceae bacterium]|nr:glycine/sarcosine/betaine reductase complex component C subunit beta [Defluviitaleaceae bacterium]MCL2275647.1 glycine/sarcosine/betaine reductase complex component C subunit beta [Defluviitaleaceae bacterium]